MCILLSMFFTGIVLKLKTVKSGAVGCHIYVRSMVIKFTV